VLLLNFILKYWSKDPKSGSDLIPQEVKSISILIPARNEEHNIRACLESIIQELNNSSINSEIIVIDDFSEDDTAQTVKSIHDRRIKLLSLSDTVSEKINAYKKAALKYGVENASGDYIIQLDADTVMPQGYISTVIAQISDHQSDMIAGPVILEDKGLLAAFQILDMMGMMAVTCAGIRSEKWYMANGANLIYKNRKFEFKDDIASGDDVFAIQTLAKEGKKITFLKEPNGAITTSSLASFKELYSQRIRWATKNKFTNSTSMKIMMAIPYLISLVILLNLFLIPFIGKMALVCFLISFLTKGGMDFLYLDELTKDYRIEENMKYFWPSTILHLVYIVAIGTLSLFVKKYEWKGRQVK